MPPSYPPHRRVLLASLALPAVPVLQGCAAPSPAMQNPAGAPAA